MLHCGVFFFASNLPASLFTGTAGDDDVTTTAQQPLVSIELPAGAISGVGVLRASEVSSNVVGDHASVNFRFGDYGFSGSW